MPVRTIFSLPVILVVALVVRVVCAAALPDGAYSLDMSRWLQLNEVLARNGNPYADLRSLNWGRFGRGASFLSGSSARSPGWLSRKGYEQSSYSWT